MTDYIFSGLCQPVLPPFIIPHTDIAATATLGAASDTRNVMEAWWNHQGLEGKHCAGHLYRAEVAGQIYRFQCQIPTDRSKDSQFGFSIPSLKEDLKRHAAIIVFQCVKTQGELEQDAPVQVAFRHRKYKCSEWLAWGTGTAKGSVEARILSGDTGRYVITVRDWQGQVEVALL